MDVWHSDVDRHARARVWRLVLVSLVLFWGAVVQAFACTWTVTAATDPGDIGYAYAYTGLGSGFCSNQLGAWEGLSSGVTCSVSANVVTAGGTFNAGGSWSYTIVGSGEACTDDEEPDPEPEDSVLPLADAIELGWGIGGVWLIVATILFIRRATL